METGGRGRSRPGIDRIDRTIAHHLADGEPAVRLEVAHRMAGPERAEIAVDGGHVALEDGGEIGIGDGCRGAGIFADLRIKLRSDGEDRIRHHFADDLGGTTLMAGVEN